MVYRHDTIAAIATPPGSGGVGIVKLSGSSVPELFIPLLGRLLPPRQACYVGFLDVTGDCLDRGIALYFPAPASYTGEHVLELHAHGSPIVLDMLLRRLIALGVRLARPGEFTERAFLNGKLDLAQAEAVADLIASSTEQAARSALHSLQGAFSNKIHALCETLIALRTYAEAAIDFVEEDIDFLAEGEVTQRLQHLLAQLEGILDTAKQGQLLRDGMTVVLAGKPNAGKSSLLNALTGQESAIVTDIAGTTRDVLRERIQIDGMPLHIIDTAGLREAKDPIEREGIRRTYEEIKKADRLLLLIDCSARDDAESWQVELPQLPPITRVYNKIDLIGEAPRIEHLAEGPCIYLSVQTGAGLDLLKEHLKACMGFHGTESDVFIARRRHLDALHGAREDLTRALAQLSHGCQAELIAEDLRQAQQKLNEITGEFTSDDLLGRIFASFCIGK